ncbi:enoyl-[acyl-carrier protein] reductase II [Jatrophihabitans sp. GAS493]|uniref:NAD(P)H-dependent flavin oxidoreductase n=1 Tax=Jatrophihabitans sp. GAS493 TaxID=1907575 RepID=UPI000BB7F78F|nr:nitronate monooxygenase [Jatrophihabitans sp. GAS493]SOD74611.1 enoyl-[acyl-carrier protein] reductase II [Jatrophihabitans sp. GAS493]
MYFENRVTSALGISIPILSAPMGWVARAELVAAVSEAGGMGLVPGSLSLEEVRSDIRGVRERTDKPFGINVPLLFAKDPRVIDMVIDEGVRFITTSAGSPATYTPMLKAAGLTVYHVVPSLVAALKAVAAGVDGLIVEGNEGAGFKSPREVSTTVLVPLVASRVNVPVIAAGGIVDGRSLASVLALGAEGVQMGTRMLASRESAVHQNIKAAVVAAAETDTVLINRAVGRPMRVLRTELSNRLENMEDPDVISVLAQVTTLYYGGDLESSLAQLGQVAGRIDEVLSVAEIFERTLTEFRDVVRELAQSARD